MCPAKASSRGTYFGTPIHQPYRRAGYLSREIFSTNGSRHFRYTGRMRRRSFLTSLPIAAIPHPVRAAPVERKYQLGSVTYQVFQNASLETTISDLEKAGYAAVE